MLLSFAGLIIGCVCLAELLVPRSLPLPISSAGLFLPALISFILFPVWIFLLNTEQSRIEVRRESFRVFLRIFIPVGILKEIYSNFSATANVSAGYVKFVHGLILGWWCSLIVSIFFLVGGIVQAGFPGAGVPRPFIKFYGYILLITWFLSGLLFSLMVFLIGKAYTGISAKHEGDRGVYG